MTDQIRIAGQSVLNSELINGLAAKDAENHALRMAQIRRSGNSSGKTDSLEKENIRLKAESASDGARIHRLRDQLDKSEETLAQVKSEHNKALADRDALILEWMHSEEAFKRLARQFGKKLGVSSQEGIDLVNQELLNAAEEDPRFEKTELKSKAEAYMKKKT